MKPAISGWDWGVKLNGLPVPVSVNKFLTKRGYPSKEKLQYLAAFKKWVNDVTEKGDLDQIKSDLFGLEWIFFTPGNRRALEFCRVEYEWVSNFVTKAEPRRRRRKDASNYIKAVEDSVADFLGIDDAYFGEFEFKTTHSETVQDFTMKIFKPKPMEMI